MNKFEIEDSYEALIQVVSEWLRALEARSYEICFALGAIVVLVVYVAFRRREENRLRMLIKQPQPFGVPTIVPNELLFDSLGPKLSITVGGKVSHVRLCAKDMAYITGLRNTQTRTPEMAMPGKLLRDTKLPNGVFALFRRETHYGFGFRVGNDLYTALHVLTALKEDPEGCFLQTEDERYPLGADWPWTLVSERCDIVAIRVPTKVWSIMKIGSLKFRRPLVSDVVSIVSVNPSGPGFVSSTGRITKNDAKQPFEMSHTASTAEGTSGAPMIVIGRGVVGIHLGSDAKTRKNFGTAVDFLVSKQDESAPGNQHMFRERFDKYDPELVNESEEERRFRRGDLPPDEEYTGLKPLLRRQFEDEASYTWNYQSKSGQNWADLMELEEDLRESSSESDEEEDDVDSRTREATRDEFETVRAAARAVLKEKLPHPTTETQEAVGLLREELVEYSAQIAAATALVNTLTAQANEANKDNLKEVQAWQAECQRLKLERAQQIASLRAENLALSEQHAKAQAEYFEMVKSRDQLRADLLEEQRQKQLEHDEMVKACNQLRADLLEEQKRKKVKSQDLIGAKEQELTAMRTKNAALKSRALGTVEVTKPPPPPASKKVTLVVPDELLADLEKRGIELQRKLAALQKASDEAEENFRRLQPRAQTPEKPRENTAESSGLTSQSPSDQESSKSLEATQSKLPPQSSRKSRPRRKSPSAAREAKD